MQYLDVLAEIESRWRSLGKRAITDLRCEHPHASVYAAAIWCFYCDYSQILSPALAANAEVFVTDQIEADGSRWSTRWVPAEWQWSVLDDVSDGMKPLYESLSAVMSGLPDQEWRKMLAQHDALVSRVARHLTEVLAKDNEHFIVAVIDDQRDAQAYNQLLRSSIAPDRLKNVSDILMKET